MENIDLTVETRVSKKTGNPYEVLVIKLPNGIEIPVFGLDSVRLALIKQYTNPSFK